jgi:hypothetical protein
VFSSVETWQAVPDRARDASLVVKSHFWQFAADSLL